MFGELTDEQKGWYLAGFADGESYFIARPLFRETKKKYKRTAFSFRWGIQVREDDAQILYDIKDWLDSFGMGEGAIYHRKRKNDVTAQVTLHYDGIRHCEVIHHIFTKYPLQAKKSRDFDMWANIYDMVKEMNARADKRTNMNPYTEEEIRERRVITNMCDMLRVGRLNMTKADLGIDELLREQSGQTKLYTQLFDEHHGTSHATV